MDILALLSSGLAFFIIAVSPGPATISTAAIAMQYGRRPSLIYGFGLSCGLIFWGLIAATGLGAVLQSSLYVLNTLKVAGGIYLLWLAYQSGRSAYQAHLTTTIVPTQQRWFMRGLILNMSNPKSVIAWMAALSVGLSANTNTTAVVAATMVCIVVGFFTNALYSVVFSLKGMMQAYQRLQRQVNAIVAVLFAGAGVGLIRSAFKD